MANVTGPGKVSSPNQDDPQELKDAFLKVLAHYQEELDLEEMEEAVEEDLNSLNEEV